MPDVEVIGCWAGESQAHPTTPQTTETADREVNSLGLFPLLHRRIRYPERNGRCERVIRTVKGEEVWLNQYGSLAEARERIGAFIEFYNHERIHSSLAYLGPRQYAALWREVESTCPERTFRGALHYSLMRAPRVS